jgi:ABC-type molybdenum transport system ATPase subunit/photorepair protein PhrA
MSPRPFVMKAQNFQSSGGEIISLTNVDIAAGHNDIITGINWSILPFERWGIVGRNGAG